MLRPAHVEGGVGVGHLERAAVSEGDAVVQARLGGEYFSGSAELLGDIEHLHRAAEFARKDARRAAQSAADVEHQHHGSNAGEARELPRRLCAPGMELAYRGQDFQGESVRFFSSCAQRLE